MLGWIAALVLAPNLTAATPPLAASDWWEKVTVTLSGDGKPQACIYETSGQAKPSADCDVVGGGAKGFGSKAGSAGQMTPDYGCAEASTERFEASAHANPAATREGFMTITIYGHNENFA